MRPRFHSRTILLILITAPPLHAGSSSGGSGAATVLIPADTISSGGGTASGGTGANAIVVTSSMGGVVGTVTAASPVVTNRQGFIPQIQTGATSPPPTGYALWASLNIPAGRDASFNGDGNGDGIPNGIAYIFGNTPVSPAGRGRIPAPPTIPADVDVFLDHSTNLNAWTLGSVRWENGAAPVFGSGFSIASGIVVDAANPAGGSRFYRYRATRR